MKYFILFIFLFSSFSCTSQTQTEDDINPVEMDSDKILIVYLSRTKNTKAVAEMIHEKVGGTLVSLELEIPYPEDYGAIVAQVAQENETGYLPPLKTKIEISQYETVFVGFPTWGMQLPPPMKTFLSENDLSGKTVIPFNTNAGYGIGSSFESVEELCPESNILEGYSTTGGIERDGILFVMEGEKEVEVRTAVNNWLSDLGF
tara:strand:+ start:101 stop:709 length:609 start_codon:yes stop_codon:yes gene_type:complete